MSMIIERARARTREFGCVRRLGFAQSRFPLGLARNFGAQLERRPIIESGGIVSKLKTPSWLII